MRRSEGGRGFHRLPGEMDRYQLLGPAKLIDPLRGNENLMTEPSAAGVNDHVSNRPGLLVHEQPRDVSDFPISRFDAISDDRLTTAQMRVVISLWLGGNARARFRLRLHDTGLAVGTPLAATRQQIARVLHSP